MGWEEKRRLAPRLENLVWQFRLAIFFFSFARGARASRCWLPSFFLCKNARETAPLPLSLSLSPLSPANQKQQRLSEEKEKKNGRKRKNTRNNNKIGFKKIQATPTFSGFVHRRGLASPLPHSRRPFNKSLAA